MNKSLICNMCLGELKFLDDNIYICESCGKKHLINSQTEEELIWISNANKNLRIGNFDDAYSEFSNILSKYPKSYEAYFGLLLSKHGIIYIDDIIENKKVPTCYNITNNSLYDDENYKLLLKYAPKDIVENYKQLIKQIEAIRVEWINKASKESPYDIFISFKQSDKENNIEKTKDYYICLELYNYLTYKCGYKVFFSPETLKNKISERYEPYIYNAINTCKVMIVYGQKAEYINSTWVKNEWIRYVKKLKDKEKKHNSLVVCYENFDAYNLPNELKGFQALNASNKDFLNILVFHIQKVINSTLDDIKIERKIIVQNPIKPITKLIGNRVIESRELGVNIYESKSASIGKLLSSAELLLKTSDFDNALKLINQILEIEPNNSDAIYLEFLIKHRVTSTIQLESKLKNGLIIHTYTLEKLFSKVKIDKALEVIKILKKLIINSLSSTSTLVDELRIYQFYNFISLYDFPDKQKFNYEVLDCASIRKDALMLFNYAIKLLDNSEVQKYIRYHEILYLTITKNQKDFDSLFNQQYIQQSFDVDVKNIEEFRIFLLDRILAVDNAHHKSLFYMYEIKKDIKYVERDLSNTTSNKELIKFIDEYLNYYLNSYDSEFEDIIKYIPENNQTYFLECVKKRYDFIKQLLIQKKKDSLFNSIIKYIEILRLYEKDSYQYKYETFIYSIKCINEEDVIKNGPIINKLNNYLEIFTSFDEKYQNKILELINEQKKYHEEFELNEKKKKEDEQKRIEEGKRKEELIKEEESRVKKSKRKSIFTKILTVIIFLVSLLAATLLSEEGENLSSVIVMWLGYLLIIFISSRDEDKNESNFYAIFYAISMICSLINCTILSCE